MPEFVTSAVDAIRLGASPVMHFRRRDALDYLSHLLSAEDKFSVGCAWANGDQNHSKSPLAHDRTRCLKDVVFDGGGPLHRLRGSLASMGMRPLFENLELRGASGRNQSSFVRGIKRLPVGFRMATGMNLTVLEPCLLFYLPSGEAS
jgi:hypothetical protein